MWDQHATPYAADLVCHVFHHWSDGQVDRSEIVVTSGACTPTARAREDDHGLPAWYLARSVPRRLCPHARTCTCCAYALGEVKFEEHQAALANDLERSGYTLSD